LTATATPTRAGYTDTSSIASGSITTYDTADYAYRTFFVLAGTTTGATLVLTTGDATGDAWTTPVRQVETATAAGTVTTAGDATVTITASGLTGSPLAVTVAVALDDQTVDYTIGTEYSGRMTSTTTTPSRVLMSYPDATSILDTLSFTGTSDTGMIAVTVIGLE